MEFQGSDISKHNISETDLVCFLNCLEELWVYPKLKIIGLGGHGHVQESENHENDGFSGFHKMKSKGY